MTRNLARHEERDDVVGEHKFGDLGQLILLLIFLIIWITDSFIFKYSIHLQEKIYLSIRLVVATLILGSAIFLVKKGLAIVFGEEREQPELINVGVFNFVRHPVYLGCILFYLGLIMTTLSIASIVIWIIIVLFYYFISKYEEKLLLEEFGNQYKEYIEKVPMIFPIKLK
jgi:protein-S-isoprenylcysteine O-methyltransferase Ste14